MARSPDTPKKVCAAGVSMSVVAWLPPFATGWENANDPTFLPLASKTSTWWPSNMFWQHTWKDWSSMYWTWWWLGRPANTCRTRTKWNVACAGTASPTTVPATIDSRTSTRTADPRVLTPSPPLLDAHPHGLHNSGLVEIARVLVVLGLLARSTAQLIVVSASA